MLGRYVREQKVLTLEEAIRKMTSANTAKVRVFDRGLLRAGPVGRRHRVRPRDRSPTTPPSSSPTSTPMGVRYVVVNGQVVLDGGRHTGARPGKIIYGPGKHMVKEGT